VEVVVVVEMSTLQPPKLSADQMTPDRLMVELLRTWRQLWRMLGQLQRERHQATLATLVPRLEVSTVAKLPTQPRPRVAVPDWDIFRNSTLHEEPEEWQ
jgi:hypothetical protein